MDAAREQPVQTVAEGWLDAEAIEAALDLAEYFNSTGYAHAANLAPLA
jgi:hypothetical protein